MALSVQLAHRSDVRELLHDLADASQPRFGELVAEVQRAPTNEGSATPTVARTNTIAESLALIAPAQRRAHLATGTQRWPPRRTLSPLATTRSSSTASPYAPRRERPRHRAEAYTGACVLSGQKAR